MLIRKERKSPKYLKCLLSGAVVLFFTLIATNGFCQEVFYEAETAVLTKGASIDTCSSCSAGKMVKQIGDANNGGVTFDIPVKTAGLYAVNVYFIVYDDRSFAITVNDELFPQEIIFRTTEGKNKLSAQKIFVPLKAGNNKIAFNNPYEGAPQLDKIGISGTPIKSATISGTIKSTAGKPLSNIEVFLSGDTKRNTNTDKSGHYQFENVPLGEYYITPSKSKALFAPYDYVITDLSKAEKVYNFTGKEINAKPAGISKLQSGKWRIEYNTASGTADFFYNEKSILSDAYAAVRIPETVTSLGFDKRVITKSNINDKYGKGVRFDVALTKINNPIKMIQTFWVYDTDYLLTEVKISGKNLSSNYMAPLVSNSPVTFLSSGDARALYVPYDNDKWTRYISFPFNSAVTSNEVSALYDNTSRKGLIIGSVEHDVWKTGIKSVTSNFTLKNLEVFGGNTSNKTRDILKHGKITGDEIKSPKVFLGFFADWRMGLDEFAKANSKNAPSRPWEKPVPFGWNSWGKIQGKLTVQKAIEVSDYFAKNLQPDNFNNGVIYIGLDAGAEKFSDEDLAKFVSTCKANKQEAGAYLGPFLGNGNENAQVTGTNYKYKDIYLYANGNKQYIDGLVAVDPTHPATKQKVQNTIERFKKLGFKYIKMDFLTHGTLEADKYFNPKVKTGIQAYNEGMQHIQKCLGDSIFLNLSISPLFPSNYSQSRRIACDTWGDTEKIEYTLNSLTYGWWLSKMYKFNDADHVVLGDFTEAENRSRVTSSVITGIFIAGDDFSADGGLIGKERAKKFLTNKDINDIAKMGKSFEPVEGDTGSKAAEMFVHQDGNNLYLAVFNFSKSAKNNNLELSRLGLLSNKNYQVKELWTGNTSTIKSGSLDVTVNPGDVQVFKFTL
ncbi:MAG: alpha-galactosidase [Sphingobacteriales bacterium]|nr:alpha-galactosidase [Sphingobacteriales bacterium]